MKKNSLETLKHALLLLALSCFAVIANASGSQEVNIQKENQLKLDAKDDPLHTGAKPIMSAEDLLTRIKNLSDNDQDLSKITKNVINGALHSNPKEMHGLTIQTMNQALNSENVISQLKQNSIYFKALAETVQSANDLLEKSMQIQTSRNKLNEMDSDKKQFIAMAKELSKRIDYQNNMIADLRNENLVLAAKIDKLNTQSSQVPTNKEEDFNKDVNENQVSNQFFAPPFTVDSTFVSAADGKRKARVVFPNGKTLPIEVGFTSGPLQVTDISDSGVKLKPLTGGQTMLLRVR